MQYVARLHAEKLKRHLYQAHKAAGGALGTKAFNMRLCPEEVSNSLTGFEHNAVSPIGIATPDMPIVLSDRCASSIMLGQAISRLLCVCLHNCLQALLQHTGGSVCEGRYDEKGERAVQDSEAA